MNELVVINKENALEVFTGEKLEGFLKEIEEDALRFVADISTAEGRRQIASKANDIAKTKVQIDNVGKELVADWKKRSKLVDNSRRKSRDFLDELKLKVRDPLTVWEKEDAERIEKERLAEELSLDWDEAIKENDLFDREKEMERKEEAFRVLEEARIEKERVERERIEEEELAKKLKIESYEREKQVAAEAKEKAEKDAERKIEAEKTKRIRAELKAKQDKIDAKKKAEKEKQDAIDEVNRLAKAKEDKRIAHEKAEREKAEKKAENLQHRKKINNEILKDLMEADITEKEGKFFMWLITEDKVRHLQINY